MVAFAIYLRQRGSSESKPVGTPHHATSVESGVSGGACPVLARRRGLQQESRIADDRQRALRQKIPFRSGAARRVELTRSIPATMRRGRGILIVDDPTEDDEMTRDQYTFTNPAELYADFDPKKQHQPEPGLDAELDPKADLGEETLPRAPAG